MTARPSRPQRIDELTAPPIVGQRYLVPTVRYPWFGKVDAWPVMGPKHNDIEHFRFERQHYHVDLRFLTDAQIRRVEKAAYYKSIEMCAAGNPLASHGLEHSEDPVLRRLVCRRIDHSFPMRAAAKNTPHRALAKAYAGHRCARNAAGLLICPHKGFALDSLVPDADGRVVCPLHGLVIDVRAGAVVDTLTPRDPS